MKCGDKWSARTVVWGRFSEMWNHISTVGAYDHKRTIFYLAWYDVFLLFKEDTWQIKERWDGLASPIRKKFRQQSASHTLTLNWQRLQLKVLMFLVSSGNLHRQHREQGHIRPRDTGKRLHHLSAPKCPWKSSWTKISDGEHSIDDTFLPPNVLENHPEPRSDGEHSIDDISVEPMVQTVSPNLWKWTIRCPHCSEHSHRGWHVL